MKPDEERLWEELVKLGGLRRGNGWRVITTVREKVKELGIPEKRAEYILEKWTAKGWYEYGVNVFYGWLTVEGMEEGMARWARRAG